MVGHTFKHLQDLVDFEADLEKPHGGPNTEAKAEYETLVKFARTNFAACNDLSAAKVAVIERFRPDDKSTQVVEQVLEWLFAPANELCYCEAPAFVTGCDCRVSQPGKADKCVCSTDECPWTKRTGFFT